MMQWKLIWMYWKSKFFFLLQKYERRRAYVKDENESRAFAKLSKEHMSSDDDDTDSEGEGGWVSQPPKYRSRTLEIFLNK